MSMKEYPAKLTTGYYRVREDWEDEASQLGAYITHPTHAVKAHPLVQPTKRPERNL